MLKAPPQRFRSRLVTAATPNKATELGNPTDCLLQRRGLLRWGRALMDGTGRTRLQGEWRSVASFSVEPGEIGLTALEEAGDGIDQGAKGRLAQLAAGLTQ